MNRFEKYFGRGNRKRDRPAGFPGKLPSEEYMDARRAYEAGAYATCVGHLDRALDLESGRSHDPQFSVIEALRLRAYAFQALNQHDLALADFQQVAGMQPHIASNHVDWAGACLRLGQFQEALDILTTGIALLPSELVAPLYLARGRAMMAAGDYRAAIDDFSIATYHDRRSAEAWYRRGLAHSALGNYQVALFDCRQGLRLGPADPRAYYAYARVLFRRGRYRQVVKSLAQVIEMKPDAGPPVSLLGRTLLLLDQPDLALPFLEKAVSMGCSDAATLAAAIRARWISRPAAGLNPGGKQPGKALPWEGDRPRKLTGPTYTRPVNQLSPSELKKLLK